MPASIFRRPYGLSPLARGNLSSWATPCSTSGPIPARTGQPIVLIARQAALEAYPRSHGATTIKKKFIGDKQGLSPLARGNHIPGTSARYGYGPIPARTGQPASLWWPNSRPRAYPRSHGATDLLLTRACANTGLSPLARGNRASALGASALGGPIPARTGQPKRVRLKDRALGAYPRSHGATLGFKNLQNLLPGLSPLARGNRRLAAGT